MMGARFRIWLVVVGLVAATAACGPRSSGGADSDGDVPVDAADLADVDPSCESNCAPQGALVCSLMGTRVKRCAEVSPGCLRWEVASDCAAQGMLCDETADPVECYAPPTCDDGVLNQGEADVDCGGSECPACDLGQACFGDEDCQSGACTAGVCMLCSAGSFGCYGNWVRQCAANESSWVDVEHCDAENGFSCSVYTGACERLQPIGSTTPTGTYYQFALFTTGNSAFLGGCDVGSDGDYLYVNRGAWYQDGTTMDVYRITLLDTDGDGLMEPNQHPDNPQHPGTIEERVLTHVTTYNVPMLGMVHRSEIFPVLDRAYFVSGNHYPGTVFEYIYGTGVTNTVADGVNNIDMGFLGFGGIDGQWYSANEWERRVYSFHAPTSEWVAEFEYPNMAGDHMDGIEVVTAPLTGVQYVYVSDMTSDYLGQYTKDANGDWVQENLFEYSGTGNYVEGMGFGTLNHFWVTGDGNDLYEIGGGDLSQYTDPFDPTNQ